MPADLLADERRLSAAEREVVAAILEGLSNAAIARRRGTSTRTVANQVASVLRKLGAGSRAEIPGRLFFPQRPGDEGRR